MGIKLTRGAEEFTFNRDAVVTRKVGRPESLVQMRPDKPIPVYFDFPKASVDVFEITGAITGATARADALSFVEDIIREPLGSDVITLTFESGLYNLGSYSVVPAQGAQTRISHIAGAPNILFVDALQLLVVRDDN